MEWAPPTSLALKYNTFTQSSLLEVKLSRFTLKQTELLLRSGSREIPDDCGDKNEFQTFQ